MESSNQDIQYPTLSTRVQSLFIDGLLMVGLMVGSGWILDKFSSKETEDGWLRAVIFVAIWFVYEPFLQTFGVTLGNYLMKIRVRKYNNRGKRINLFQAYIRFIIKFFLGWISFLTIGAGKERLAMHDMASGSIVVPK